jgi:hypothetical protein
MHHHISSKKSIEMAVIPSPNLAANLLLVAAVALSMLAFVFG